MAVLRHYRDWREGYVDLVSMVKREGAVTNSRAGVTMNVRDAIFTIAPESLDLPLGVGRKINTALAAAEAIQLCAGVGMPALTEAVAASVAGYVRDPDGTVHGNYGKRVGLQLVDVVEKLQHDPTSRQAVVQVWDKGFDSRFRDPMPKDIPCTLTITVGLTPARTLWMSVVMRSNDVWLGVPFDVFQFRQLQRTLCNVLRASPGEYCHHAVSLHLYDRDLARVSALELDRDWTRGVMPTGIHPEHVADLQTCFIRVLTGEPGALEHPSHEWYHARLGRAYETALG